MSIYDNLPNKVSLAGKTRKVEEDVYGVNEEYPGLIRPYELGVPMQDAITEINQDLTFKEDIANKEQTLTDDLTRYPSSHAVSQAILALPKPLRFIGSWDAEYNDPELIVPDLNAEGHMYYVFTSGTQFGIDFTVGDFAVYQANGYLTKWDAGDFDNKLDKYVGTGTQKVYAVSTAGAQQMIDVVDTSTTAGTIVKRNSSGRIVAANASSGTDVVNVTFGDGRYYVKGATLNQALQFGSNSTYGLQFFESNAYRIYVAYPSDSSWGGGVLDSPSAVSNMYFRLANPAYNNNFVFRAAANGSSMADNFVSIGNSGLRSARDIIVLNEPSYPSKLIFKNKGYGNKFGFEPDFSSATKKLHLKSVLDNTAGADPALNKTIATFDSDGNTYFPTHDDAAFTIGNLDFFYSTIRNRDNNANGMYIGDDFNEMLAPGGFYIHTDNDNSKLVINGESYSHHTFGKQYLQGDTLPTPADGTSDTYMITGSGLATDEGVLGGTIRGQSVYSVASTRHGNMINISRKEGTIYIYNIGGSEVNPISFVDTLPLVMDLTSWDYLKLIRMP